MFEVRVGPRRPARCLRRSHGPWRGRNRRPEWGVGKLLARAFAAAEGTVAPVRPNGTTRPVQPRPVQPRGGCDEPLYGRPGGGTPPQRRAGALPVAEPALRR